MAVKKGVKKTKAKKKTRAGTGKATAKKKSCARTAKKKKAASRSSGPKMSAREKKIQKIKERLIQQKEQLLSDAESALNNDLQGQILFPDMGDQASAEIDRNFMLRLKGREQKLLNKIEGVLETIEAGTYGICEACGNEISIKRLEARPVTTMCIECKTEQEEEERLRE